MSPPESANPTADCGSCYSSVLASSEKSCKDTDFSPAGPQAQAEARWTNVTSTTVIRHDQVFIFFFTSIACSSLFATFISFCSRRAPRRRWSAPSLRKSRIVCVWLRERSLATLSDTLAPPPWRVLARPLTLFLLGELTDSTAIG
jgi:hypothetical protein